jgi:hypothetical protein
LTNRCGQNLPHATKSNGEMSVPWNVLLVKLIVAQLAKKFPVFYETQRFNIMLLICWHLIPCWDGLIHCTSLHIMYFSFVLILSLHISLYVGLQSGLFPLYLPTKALYAFLFTSMFAKCSVPSILDLCILRSSSLCSFV